MDLKISSVNYVAVKSASFVGFGSLCMQHDPHGQELQ